MPHQSGVTDDGRPIPEPLDYDARLVAYHRYWGSCLREEVVAWRDRYEDDWLYFAVFAVCSWNGWEEH
jgi:hypothetical protein